MGFAKFMSSTLGRGIRVVAGIALILVGYFMLQEPVNYIVMVIGVLPILAGVFDFCLFAPLFGGPFKGEDARQAR